MKKELTKIIKHSFIYGLGRVATQLIAFLLIPVYTTHLTTEDYGILQICNVFAAILGIIITLGMSSSLFKVYFLVEEKEKGKVLGTTFIIFFISSISVLLPLFIFGNFLSKYIIGDFSRNGYLFKILLIAVFFDGLINLQFAVLRAREQSIKFSIITIIRMVVSASMNILFVAVLKRNFIGLREAALISSYVCFIIMFPIIVTNIKLKFSKEYAKEVLNIGIPLAFAGLAAWVLNLTDRYMIKFLLPKEEALSQLGIYSLGDRFAMIIKFILVLPFMMAWGPLMYSYQNNPDVKKIFVKVLHSFSFIAGILFFFIALFSQEILKLMVRQETFIEAYKVVPILTFSKMQLGIFMIFTVGVTLTNKTKYIAFANYIAAGLNILLNYFLIPLIGTYGAAIASLISYLTSVGVLYYFAQKQYYVEWNFNKIIIYLGSLFFIALIGVYSNIQFFTKILLFLIIIALSPMSNLISYKELIKGLKYVRGKY
jgi:O-antigen/teichoic acid export membrane protein